MDTESETRTQLAPAKLTALRWLVFVGLFVLFYLAYGYFPAPPTYLLAAVFGCFLQIGSVLYLNRHKPEWGEINILIGYGIPISLQFFFQPRRGIYDSLAMTENIALVAQYCSIYGITLAIILVGWTLVKTFRQRHNSS